MWKSSTIIVSQIVSLRGEERRKREKRLGQDNRVRYVAARISTSSKPNKTKLKQKEKKKSRNSWLTDRESIAFLAEYVDSIPFHRETREKECGRGLYISQVPPPLPLPSRKTTNVRQSRINTATVSWSRGSLSLSVSRLFSHSSQMNGKDKSVSTKSVPTNPAAIHARWVTIVHGRDGPN